MPDTLTGDLTPAGSQRYPANGAPHRDGGMSCCCGMGMSVRDPSETDSSMTFTVLLLLEDIGGMLVRGTVLLVSIGSANMWALIHCCALGTATVPAAYPIMYDHCRNAGCCRTSHQIRQV